MSSMDTPDTTIMRDPSTHSCVEYALVKRDEGWYRRTMAKKKTVRVSGESLRRRREALHLTQGELSRMSGIDQRDISRAELEKIKGGETKLQLIAFLERLEKREALQPANVNDMTPKRLAGPQVVHGIVGGAYDLPFYRPRLAEGGIMAVPATPDGQIKRPDYLIGKDGCYAIEMIGDSMSPQFEDRDKLYVDPNVLPQMGKACVFLSPERDHAKVLVLASITPDAWLVRGPHKDDPVAELDRTEWPHCEAIQGVHSPHTHGTEI